MFSSHFIIHHLFVMKNYYHALIICSFSKNKRIWLPINSSNSSFVSPNWPTISCSKRKTQPKVFVLYANTNKQRRVQTRSQDILSLWYVDILRESKTSERHEGWERGWGGIFLNKFYGRYVRRIPIWNLNPTMFLQKEV